MHLSDLRASMQSCGLQPPPDIIPGRWTRFSGAGKKGKNKAGYCYLFPDGLGAVFGDFTTGLREVWQAEKVKTYTPSERVDYQRMIDEAQKKAAEEQEKEYARAAEYARKKWESLPPSIDDHGYLSRKGVKSYGLRQTGDLLVLPLIDAAGKISTYQTIALDGTKRFLTGGRKKGCAYPIEGNAKIVFIVEGYATGASVHEATECMVLVAVDAGNIQSVVEAAIKKEYPLIIIAADNDNQNQSKNVGINEAQKVCKLYPQVTWIAPPAPDGQGVDWNDYVTAHGLKASRALLMQEPQPYTAEATAATRETVIPAHLIEGRGLMSLGMEAVHELSATNIPQYNFPIVLAHISAALAGKIRCGHVHPSCFFIKVGGTSTGKTETDKYTKSSIFPHFNQVVNKKDGSPSEIKNTLYGPTDFASGAGLMRAVQRQPICLMMLDEITFLFMKTSAGYDSNAQSKTKAILELSTSAGMRFERPYSDTANTIVIEYPVINMVGNATPGIFKTFTIDDLHSGLIQRFDFFCYDGHAPRKGGVIPQTDSPQGREFAERLGAIHKAEKPDSRYDIIIDTAVDIGMDAEAEKLMAAYSDETIDRVNAEDDDGIKGIISRRYHAAIKFGLIHAGATRTAEDLFAPLQAADIEYGQALATLLADWKLNVLIQNIHAGDFDALCQMFLEGAKGAIKAGKRPTGKIIVNRKPRLKNITPRIWDDIVKVLRARGQIRIVEEGKTVYEPLAD